MVIYYKVWRCLSNVAKLDVRNAILWPEVDFLVTWSV